MTSYLLLLTFLTEGIQVLQHLFNKCMDSKGIMLRSKLHLVAFHKYLGQPMTFLADHSVYIYIYIYIEREREREDSVVTVNDAW